MYFTKFSFELVNIQICYCMLFGRTDTHTNRVEFDICKSNICTHSALTCGVCVCVSQK